MKNKILILLYIVFLYESCMSQENQKFNNDEKYVIIFANGFLNDKIDLLFNDTYVVRSTLLTSDKSDGITNLNIKVSVRKNKYIVLNSLVKKKIFIKSKKRSIELKLFYQNIWYSSKAIHGEDKYVIIDVISGVKFTQQFDKPFFD